MKTGNRFGGCAALLYLMTVRDAINEASAVVADQQCAVRGDSDAHGPAIYIFSRRIRHHSRQKWDGVRRGFSIPEPNEDHLVSGTRSAVPGAVLGYERATLIGFRELRTRVEGELQRRNVCSQKNVRNDRLATSSGF